MFHKSLQPFGEHFKSHDRCSESTKILRLTDKVASFQDNIYMCQSDASNCSRTLIFGNIVKEKSERSWDTNNRSIDFFRILEKLFPTKKFQFCTRCTGSLSDFSVWTILIIIQREHLRRNKIAIGGKKTPAETLGVLNLN